MNELFRPYKHYKTKRLVVDNYHAFVEKVELLTMGICDRIVEIYKHNLQKNLKEEYVRYIFWEYSEDFKEKKVAVYRNAQEKKYLEVDMNEYNNLMKMYSPMKFYNRNNDYK